MSDVVLKFPVRDDQESALFGSYLGRFIQSRAAEAEHSADNDAPFLMVHSDPGPGVDLKVVTFQGAAAARAFSSGWSRVLRSATAERAA